MFHSKNQKRRGLVPAFRNMFKPGLRCAGIVGALCAMVCLAGCGAVPSVPANAPASVVATSAPESLPASQASSASAQAFSAPSSSSESTPPSSAASVAPQASQPTASGSLPASSSTPEIPRVWKPKLKLEERLSTYEEQASQLVDKADRAEPAGSDADAQWDQYYALSLEIGRLQDQITRLEEDLSNANESEELSDTAHFEMQKRLNEMEQSLVLAQEDIEWRFNAFL